MTLLFALGDMTWIAIVQLICACVTSVVGIIVTKKFGETKKAIDDNTQVTIDKSNEIIDKADKAAVQADKAAIHAKRASMVGEATYKQTKATGEKADLVVERTQAVEQQVKELQEDSALSKKEHFSNGNGDKPKTNGDC